MTNTTMIPNPPRFNHVIAFEVAKANVVVHILPSGAGGVLPNTAVAVRRLLTREVERNARQGLGRMLVVCEATGGYERHVLAAAIELGVSCHRAHGYRVRAFATGRRKLAKSDAIDAGVLAAYGHDTPDLDLYEPPPPEQAALRELMGRRAELKDMIAAERCRLEHVGLKIVHRSLQTHLKMLERQLESIECEIESLVRRHQAIEHRARLMQTLAGIGPVTAATVLAYMPEIGRLSGPTAAALAGVAPFDRDSGKRRGARHIFAGRAEVRRCLYMAATAAIRSNPLFSAFARRLTARGKPFKVVVTAVMRKLIVILNAILRDGRPWQHAQTA